jgi:hypothetical protein
MPENLKGQIISFIKEKYLLLIALFCLCFSAKIIAVKLEQLVVINNDTWCLELFIYFILLIKIIFLASLLIYLISTSSIKTYLYRQNNKLSKLFYNILILSIKISMIVFFVSTIIYIILLHSIYNLNKDNLEDLLVLIIMNETYAYSTISILVSTSCLIFTLYSKIINILNEIEE